MSSGTCRPLEANPDVLKNYVKRLDGPSNVDYYDVYGTDKSALATIPQPVFAVLLVFPITKKLKMFRDKLVKDNRESLLKDNGKAELLHKIWFTKQTVDNACGTVALLHIFNNVKIPRNPGGRMATFYDKTASLSYDERAFALQRDSSITNAHKIAQQEGQSTLGVSPKNVIGHFVSFINIDNRIVELDGRNDFPLIHCETTTQMFLHDCCELIKSNFLNADPSEYRFSIIALVQKPE